MRAPPAFAHHENGKNNDQREAQSDEGFVCLSRIKSSCKTKKENACEKQRPCNDFLPHDRSSGSIISQTEWKLVPEQSGILKIHCEGETETVNVLHDHFVAVVQAHGWRLDHVCSSLFQFRVQSVHIGDPDVSIESAVTPGRIRRESCIRFEPAQM